MRGVVRGGFSATCQPEGNALVWHDAATPALALTAAALRAIAAKDQANAE